MLLTIYEEQNSAKFSAKFTTPITLPKNAELSLLKAYIPRDHSITIDDTNNQLTIYIHSKDADAKQVISIPNGSYGIDAFAKTLQSHIKLATSVVNITKLGQLSNLTCAITPKIDDNQVANDSITFYLRPQSLYPNFYYEANFDSVGNQISGGNFTEQKAQATDTYTIVKGNGTLRCSVYQDNTPADKTGWDNMCVIDRALGRTWFSATTQSDYAESRPPFNDTHTLINFTLGDIQGSQSSFLVGVNQHGSAIDLTGVVVGDLSSCDQIAGLSLAVVVYGNTANGKTAGELEVFEDIAGTFTSLGTLTNANLGTDDEVIIVIPNNTTAMAGCEYFVKYTNGQIRKLGVANAHRYIPLARQVFNPCFSFFNGSGAVDVIKNLRFGMDAGYMPPALDATKGAGKFDEYGKYIKLALGGATNDNKSLNDTLGFTHDEYEEDGTAGADRVQAIEESNDGDLETNDSKQPYLNLNITNLPITSFSCDHNDPVGGITTHDYSKCVASIPRYNADDSHFDNLAIVFDDNTQSIRLNNKSEIVLSSLDCRLQNCDGSYPKDLLTPSSFVFKISGDNTN